MDDATDKKLGEVEEGKEGPDVGEDIAEVTIEKLDVRHLTVELNAFRPQGRSR